MEILTPTQLNRYMAFRIREDERLSGVMLRGEMSDLRPHYASGHLYFSVKDEACRIKAVMFASNASQLRFSPENGMKGIFTGNIGMYEKTGEVQLYVTDIVPEGTGAIFLAAEQLKIKLSGEGLFSDEFKKPIPRFPKRIAAVTSAGGAAIQDIINILSRRYPVAELVVFDCLVQGAEAPRSIIRALKAADASGCDVIICGRGGGSIEDLNAFNDEELARALFACSTPVISAVGHEIDYTIADLVADLRAPTPSAAAELAAGDMSGLADRVAGYRALMDKALADLFERKADVIERKRLALEALYPEAKLVRLTERAAALKESLRIAMASLLERKQGEMAAAAAGLENLSPLKTMSRGYSLVMKDGSLVVSADALKKGDSVTLRFSDGERRAEIKG